MTKITDHAYFTWLISQIQIYGNRTYNEMLERLHSIEFVWFVPNDDNRLHDALNLRSEYFDGTQGREIDDIMKLPIMTNRGATFLEVLVALSRRVAFLAGGEAEHWAWHLMENLGLTKLSDPLTVRKIQAVNDICETVIWRTYERTGDGGFFPLNVPLEDQTKIEIWQQMDRYVAEIQKP
jgi:hypothetical protein